MLSWTAVSDDGGAQITNYKIYRNGILLKELRDVHNFTDTGLINGINYLYNVSAVNSNGESPKSIGVETVPRTISTAPQNLQAISGNAQIKLLWKLPTNDGGVPITSYRIYRGTASGAEILFIKDYTNGTAWNDINVINGIKYFYMVSAINSAGESQKSNEQNAIPYNLSKPGPITIDKPTKVIAYGGNTQISLKWTASKTNGLPMQYNIYRYDKQNGLYIWIGSTNTTEYIDKGLTNDFIYWYEINAQNSYGYSENTTAISATPTSTSTAVSPYPIGLFLIIIVMVIIIIISETVLRKKKISI
jgi:fibronectin type 3 domain-containing protein